MQGKSEQVFVMLLSNCCREKLLNRPFLVVTALIACLSCCSSENPGRDNTTREILFFDYDKDVRPNQGVAPLTVELDLYVESFANIAEADMEYTVFGYIRHYWTDKRFARKFNETIRLKGSTIDCAWIPDTYVTNRRESNLVAKNSDARSLFEIHPNGTILYSRSYKIVAACDMRLEHFPMDTQKCNLSFGSYGYTIDNVIYKWKDGTGKVEKKSIAQFDLNEKQLNSTTAPYVTGNYSLLIISFNFKRRLGYYIIQAFFPNSLVVVMSWIVFWLDPNDMTDRVGLGITTILTLMFLLGSVNMSLPRVSYPKAIDWYLIGSFVFVFLVVMECVLVYILRPRNRDSKNGAQRKDLDLEVDTINNLQDTPGEEDIALKQRKSSNSSYGEPAPRDVEDEMIEESPAHAQKGFGRCPCNYGKIVDYICRFLFPFSFILFNVIYWYNYLSD